MNDIKIAIASIVIGLCCTTNTGNAPKGSQVPQHNVTCATVILALQDLNWPKLKTITKVTIEGPIAVVIEKDRKDIEVSGDEECIDDLVITEQNNTLCIALKNSSPNSYTAPINVCFSMRAVQELHCYDKSLVTIKDHRAQLLKIIARNDSTVFLQDVDIEHLHVTGHDTANINTFGKTFRQHITMHDTSTYNGDSMNSWDSNIVAKDRSHVFAVAAHLFCINRDPQATVHPRPSSTRTWRKRITQDQ